MPENRTVQEMMEGFLASLNAEYTQKTYATPLRHFAVYLEGRGIHVDRADVGALEVDHAIDFVPWLRHECFPDPEQPAKATLQLYLTAVYRFYRSLLKRGVQFGAADIARLEETYRDARNIRGEPRPKDPKLSAVKAIIKAARSVTPVSGEKPVQRKRELTRLRDIAIVEMLRSTGCRVGELIALRRGDLDWLAHSALVKGKGSKYRKVYLDDRAWGTLKLYLHARQDGADARALARLPVFCGHGNRSGRIPSPLTTRHVARIIQDLARRAGIAEVGVTPHYFRHVFATRALDRTENLALVQDMLGHASPATTRVYARTDEQQRQEGYARVWGDGERMEQSVDLLAEDVRPDSAHPSLSLESRSGAARSMHDALHGLQAEPGSAPADVRRARMRVALVELWLSTGCSLEELVALRLRDVNLARRRIRLRSARHLLAQGADCLVPLDDFARQALDAYLAVRAGERATEPLFCGDGAETLTAYEAYGVLRQVAAQAGVEESELRDLL